MSMQIDINALRVAPRAAALEVGEPMALTLTDLALFENPVEKPVRAIQRLTERHHMVARLLAIGTKPTAVAVLTGYSTATIKLLQDDPSFQELLAFYSTDVDDDYRQMKQQLLGMGDDALQEMRRRIEETPEKLSFKELTTVVQMVADRTGNGPTSTNVNVDVKIGLADRMRAARERSQEIAAAARDITPSEAAE